jgi:hypothetical protein
MVDNGMNVFTYIWGCGYAYGFRVPFLAVSEWTLPGYVSGAVTYPVMYPPPAEYTHDFGSILAFTEHNFGLGPIAPTGYTYADQNSLDYNWCQLRTPHCTPLWDFFGEYYVNPNSPEPFTPIPLVNAQDTPAFFQNYYTNHNATPTGPDEGADDN